MVEQHIKQAIDKAVADIRAQHGVFSWYQNNQLKEFLMSLGGDWFEMVLYVEHEHGILI